MTGSIQLWRQAPFGSLLWLCGAVEHEAPEDEIIHFRVHEATVGVVGCTNHRFTTNVERGVDQHAGTGGLLETQQQIIEQRIMLRSRRLDSRRVIDVGDGWQ